MRYLFYFKAYFYLLKAIHTDAFNGKIPMEREVYVQILVNILPNFFYLKE